MFFFNPELLLISAVDKSNTSNVDAWVWITDPYQIITIFLTAFIGMMAFSCFTQGYFLARLSLLERLLFLIIVPFMFLPKIMKELCYLESQYVSYTIGISIFLGIYIIQKAVVRNQKGAPLEGEI